MNIDPCCICTTVSDKALRALLEASGRGTYRDDQPWLVARDLLIAGEAAGRQLPILFAVGQPSRFSHWGFIETLQVVELHRATWETACTFTPLKPVNPIFEAIDSLFLKPTAEQLDRERLEGIPQHRYPLTEAELHPYAICETPAFILKEA
jgi:hypothetical protein